MRVGLENHSRSCFIFPCIFVIDRGKKKGHDVDFLITIPGARQEDELLHQVIDTWKMQVGQNVLRSLWSALSECNLMNVCRYGMLYLFQSTLQKLFVKLRVACVNL